MKMGYRKKTKSFNSTKKLFNSYKVIQKVNSKKTPFKKKKLLKALILNLKTN